MKKGRTYFILLLTFVVFGSNGQENDPGPGNASTYRDVSFFSEAFQTNRWYRIYLPDDYEQNSGTRYPVIYYFHGYGGRYKWDGYDPDDDVYYPGNGRKDPPFVMEWNSYVKDHDVIIVTWDGYEPNLHEGKKMREGIKYGDAFPYDYMLAHDTENHHWGWDFRLYFRDLVQHVDQSFRTIPDRDHRAITGLSMGGQSAYYIAGQNKDLVSSVSAFDPAANFPLYGPKGHQSVFPTLQLYRSLKGLSVRLTMTDGDWLKYDDWKMKRIFEAADLSHFEAHIADYPDHWAADIDKQLDFHMEEFQKRHPAPPDNWHHLCPAFPSFEVWGYNIHARRSQPALTILEDVSPGYMKILAREFIPDGPIVENETVAVSTGNVYSPNAPYQLATYNLSSGKMKIQRINASADGRLTFELGGGGHLVGINGKGHRNEARLKIVFDHNREYFYFEEGVPSSLDFTLINLGKRAAKDIEITVSSTHPYIKLKDDKVKLEKIAKGALVSLKDQFSFSFTHHSDSSFAGSMLFEVKVNGKLSGTQKVMFFTIPESRYITEDDIILLDGRTVTNIPVYLQGPNIIQLQNLSGGEGNGNGILEGGENALAYIRLPKGLGPNDADTFHRTYLINHFDDSFMSVKKLSYEMKLNQASMTSASTVLSLMKNTPDNYQLDLLFRVESLYNDPDDPTSRTAIYAHKYDYRRVKLKVNQVVR